VRIARDVGEFFSLLDERLALGTEGYSVAMLAKIEYAGANHPSFAQAADALGRLAELEISAKHTQRIVERLGCERAARRDAEVEKMRGRQLFAAHAQPPTTVAIHVDAGKVQLRADDGQVGVRQPHWGDTKVACLETYTTTAGPQDPKPQPPAAFLDPPRVVRLCQEMQQIRGIPATAPTAPKPGAAHREDELSSAPRPERLLRTAVATMQNAEAFGWMVSAEAMRRGFYQAQHCAVLGDGGNWIEPLGQMHFPGWVQILDFLHLLTHLYAAASAAYGGRKDLTWRLYERTLRAAWAGQVPTVQTALREQLGRLGPPPKDAPPDDPRRTLDATLAYVERNAGRMDYPRYRREGLPITSAAVESLIKQFNQRVKGTEKFWLRGGAEAVLQVRAAYLSDDGRAEEHYAHRPRGRAAGQRRLRPVA
jgi:hypothetical protein